MTRHPEAARLEGFDELTGAERQDVARHALGCGRCREILTRQDPSRLFAFLALQPVPEEALNRLSARIEIAIDREASPIARRRWYSAAAAAAAVLLAVIFGTQLDRLDPPSGMIARDARSEPVTASASPVVRHESVLPARGIELLSTPGEADVVELALGDTQVVMIFDSKLDI